MYESRLDAIGKCKGGVMDVQSKVNCFYSNCPLESDLQGSLQIKTELTKEKPPQGRKALGYRHQPETGKGSHYPGISLDAFVIPLMIKTVKLIRNGPRAIRPSNEFMTMRFEHSAFGQHFDGKHLLLSFASLSAPMASNTELWMFQEDPTELGYANVYSRRILTLDYMNALVVHFGTNSNPVLDISVGSWFLRPWRRVKRQKTVRDLSRKRGSVGFPKTLCINFSRSSRTIRLRFHKRFFSAPDPPNLPHPDQIS
ncbi:hypothetical protein B0H34DRAFT_676262 [Crassisporium funariophilum]|nr:hypothetical protein B0H34DRAFT_676262 [Crassisporium funariophilum]